jgi:glycosyltransferase involved in cell wall biosynthesis
MKVLFFIESLRAGGKERRILELLKGLKRYPDIEVELILTRKEIHYPEFYELNIPLHIIERKFLKKDPILFIKFYKIAQKFQPDLIHVWGHMVAVYAVPTVWKLGIPLLNNEITDATPGQKLLGKDIVFNASAKIIANTRAGLKAYGAPEAKSGVIYNGFNFSRLKDLPAREDVRAKFNISTPYVVGMVATFSPYKDYKTYIKAALDILKRRDDVTFLCIGDGDDSSFKRMVPAGKTERILFLGRQDKVESIMNICDVGVLVTDIKNHAEGISNALMEFMALSRPVIATNFGGSVELVINNQTGFLIEAYDHETLAERLNTLITDDKARLEMGNACKHRVETEFSIDKMISSFYNEYKALPSKSWQAIN